MKKRLTISLILSFLTLFLILSPLGVMAAGKIIIDGDMKRDEWRDSRTEIIFLEQKFSNCNIDFALMASIERPKENALYLCFNIIQSDKIPADSEGKAPGLLLTFSDGSRYKLDSEGNESLYNPALISVEKALVLRSHNECILEMRLAFLKGLPENPLDSVQLIDSLGKYSNVYKVEKQSTPTNPSTTQTTKPSTSTKPVSYKIRFDANGGRGGKTYNLTEGEMPVPPTVTREGYTFNGWNPAVTKVKGDADYKAVWVKIPSNQILYKVKFDSNGGRGGKTYNLGKGELPVPPTVSRDGYIFNGWQPAIVPVKEDTVYKAVWVKETDKSTTSAAGTVKYKVKFDSNGGRGGKTLEVVAGSLPIPPTVTKTGYIFQGWDKPLVPAASDTEYTAVWVKNTAGEHSQEATNSQAPNYDEEKTHTEKIPEADKYEKGETAGDLYPTGNHAGGAQSDSPSIQQTFEPVKAFSRGQLLAVALASVLVSFAFFLISKALILSKKKDDKSEKNLKK